MAEVQGPGPPHTQRAEGGEDGRVGFNSKVAAVGPDSNAGPDVPRTEDSTEAKELEELRHVELVEAINKVNGDNNSFSAGSV